MTTLPPIVPPGVITQEFHTPRAVRRGVIAGVAGNVLEWYDFALFGYFAQQIGTHFFPAHNPTASLLAAFGTFAAGFLMRPLGGVLFGWVGDKFGRKQALLWSVMAMAFPSFFIGLLPTTATIGIAAPICSSRAGCCRGSRSAGNTAPRPCSWWREPSRAAAGGWEAGRRSVRI